MKITLIRYHDEGNVNTRLPSSLNEIQGALPPLGIAYLAAVLEEDGFAVSIIDAQAMNYTAGEVRDILKKDLPDLAKECGSKVIIGGTHLEILPTETLSYDFIDYGMMGEGELALRQLARVLRDNTDVSDVPGLVYRKDGKIIQNPMGMVEDLDTLPFPARHLLPNDRYSSIIGLHPVTTMFAGRGCPFKCGFCFKQHSDSNIRFRSPEKVVDEMEHVVKTYGVREIMFYDDTMTMSKKFMHAFCDEIIRRKLTVKWEAPSRVDTVDEPMLRKMKQANCIRLRFGVESGNAEILKLMNKKITLEKVKSVFDLTRKIGIERFAYFIVGYITETPETMRDSIRFAHAIKPDLVMFTVATPQPNTSLNDLAVEQGFVSPHYWQDFTLGKKMDRIPFFVPDAEQWVKKAYRSLYFDPWFVMKKLSQVRSFDQFKKMAVAGMALLKFRMSGKE